MKLIITALGMAIDSILLLRYLQYYFFSINNKFFFILSYIAFWGINFVMGFYSIPLFLKIVLNLVVICLIENFVYRIRLIISIREGMTFILILGISELLIIPIIFLRIGSFNSEIFNDINNPQIWMFSMLLSRFISILIFQFYRRISRKQKVELERNEIALSYAPLFLIFIMFLVFAENYLNIENIGSGILIPLGICVAALLIFTLLQMFFLENYLKYRNYKEEIKFLREKNRLQYEYYKSQMNTNQELKVIMHDLKNHILIAKEKNDYFNILSKKINNYFLCVDSGNKILDILLYQAWNNAKENDIKIEIAVEDNINIEFMEETEICSMFGNILDNAIDGTKCIASKNDRKINIKISIINSFFFIKIENNCMKESIKTNSKNIFLTNKEDINNHGIGIITVKKIVEKYKGTCLTECKENKFIQEILIPLPDYAI